MENGECKSDVEDDSAHALLASSKKKNQEPLVITYNCNLVPPVLHNPLSNHIVETETRISVILHKID
jgi:hypothetical protein